MSNRAQRKLFESTDCLTSALSINCCQFGCLIQDVPIAEYSGDNADWMTQLRKAAPEIKLRDLVIPGTHDSASSTIPKTKLFSAVGLTQNLNLGEQLRRGMRYLDVRLAGSDTGTSIFHGCLEGSPIQNVLNQVNDFLEQHPGEFVILELVQEYGRDYAEAKRVQMLNDVKSTFGDKMWTENDKTKLMETKLKDLDKQVCVVLHARFYDFEVDGVKYDEKYIIDKYGMFCSQRWMLSQWHNTRDTTTLLEGNLQDVQKNGRGRGKFFNSQFVLTPGVGGAQEVLQLLIGQLSLRPVSFATKLYQKDILDDFIRANADEPWNLVMLDFCDLAPALVSFLIGLNFPESLVVTKAAVNAGGDNASIDVTSKMKPFIKRGKVLYLTNIQQDLGLDFDEGKLTVAYKLANEYRILDVDFDESTEIVLGQYSQNEGELVHVDMQKQPRGVYSRGKIVNDRGEADESGTVLEYDANSGKDVKFSIAC